MTRPATAVVLTVGNEIVFGDVENTNASWLARRLAELGLEVRLLAAVRDSVDEVADFLRAEMGSADRRHRHRRARRNARRPDPGGRGGGVRCPDRGDPRARRVAARALRRARPRGLRGALGAHSAWRGTAREPARRRTGLRPRQRPRPAGSAARDGGDVRDPGGPLPRASRSAPGGAGTRPARGRSSRSSRRRPSAIRRVTVGSYPSFLDSGPEVEVVLKSADARRWARRQPGWRLRSRSGCQEVR